jgi:hypothetical protein
MMIPSVPTQPIVEEEILLTPMATNRLRTRMTETIMVDEEAPCYAPHIFLNFDSSVLTP